MRKFQYKNHIKGMLEEESCFNLIFRSIGYVDLAYKVVSYLDSQTIESILYSECQQQKMISNQVKDHSKQSHQSYMRNLLASESLVRDYINKTDRAMYYSFYQEAQFLDNEKSLIPSIIITQTIQQNSVNKVNFATLYEQIGHLVNQIKAGLLTDDQTEELKRIVTDPMLPLPSMKRENEGMFCNSTLQIFLVGLRFPHYNNDDNFNAFEQFFTRVEAQEQQSFKTFFQIQKNKHHNKKQYENLHLVRYLPYEITFNNYKELLLKNVSLHNLIVYLFAFIDIWLNATHVYLETINDPFYKFIELMTRYSIFRATIIEVQEALSALFKQYESLYSDTIKDSIFQSSSLKPRYCFWRPALTKWFSKMHILHKEMNDVYFLLLTKKREQRILQIIDDETEQNSTSSVIKSEFMSLKSNIQMSSMTSSIKESLYSSNHYETAIESLVADNQFISESLIFEYIEYMIDLSINEETVHWCGHSQHKLTKPFLQFLQNFLTYNSKFYHHIDTDFLSDVILKDIHSQLYAFLIQSDFKLLEEKNLKSVILRQIIQQIIQSQIFCTENNISEKKDNSEKNLNQISVKDSIKTTDSVSQKEIPIFKPMIFYDFSENDEKLRYFNQKAKICETIEGDQKYFFQIPPELSPQQMLSKSIGTNDSSESEQIDDDESYEYMSHEGDQQCNEIEQKVNLSNEHKIQTIKSQIEIHVQGNEQEAIDLAPQLQQKTNAYGSLKQKQNKQQFHKESGSILETSIL